MKYKKMLYILIIYSATSWSTDYQEMVKLTQQFEQKHDLKLYWDESDSIPKSAFKIGYLFAESHDYKQLHAYLNLLDIEFSKYPKSFHKNTGLKGIATVKYLNIAGYAGTFNQKRSAVPDIHANILYYDFKSVFPDEPYQRSVVHHEYFHLIDDEINGHGGYWKDPVWMSFNDPEHSYGSGGAWSRNEEFTKRLSRPKKGFIDHYSTTGVEEDKAVVFASLMIENDKNVVLGWMKYDSILKQKIQYMKKFIEGIPGGMVIDLALESTQ